MTFPDYPPPPQLPPMLAHSGIGIASFVLSLLAAACLFGVVVAAGILQGQTASGSPDESALFFVVGLFILLFMLLALIALCLGIGGLLQRHRRKVFAMLGTLFSALSLLGTVGLMALGWALG